MFQHPGRQLKTLGMVIFSMSMISMSLGGGFLASGFTKGDGLAIFLGAVIGLFIGMFIGWLNSILLIALGELVENTTVIRELLSKQKNKKTFQAPKPVSVPVQKAAPTQKRRVTVQKKAAPPAFEPYDSEPEQDMYEDDGYYSEPYDDMYEDDDYYSEAYDDMYEDGGEQQYAPEAVPDSVPAPSRSPGKLMCPNCHGPISTHTIYCARCGAKIK